MGEIIDAIIFGIVQGLTEFLPVSSSGHLELAKAILDGEMGTKESMMMTVALHLATALSTIVIFRKDIIEIIKGLLQFKWNEEFKFSLFIVVSMIPAAFVGVLFEEEMEAMFSGNLLLVGLMLVLTGSLLLLADRAKDTTKKVGMKESIIIGISQAIATLPGISRSGATISTSVLLGIDKSKAARFSFLMVVPLILGKVAKDVLTEDNLFENMNTGAMAIGFVVAFVTGLVACTWMIKLVKQSKLSYFAYYCFLVGIVAVGFHFIG
ncbi:MAG: undecaprenyl-diphosphatase [Flavobacteriales bacterium]|jgi:undecaprenyl-diphosphatase